MGPIDRHAFVVACHVTLELARSPEVAAAWDAGSACEGMSVGGLTQHVLAQVRHVVTLLGEPPRADDPIALLDHYAGADWVAAGADDEANTSIRDSSNEAAVAGPEAVVDEVVPLLDRLPDVLAAPRSPDTAYIPWQGWALTTDDFLVTRAMELVVHTDDLAASVGLPTPDFPEPVVRHVVDLLAGVAVRRHGQAAVVRALSRPQRAPASVSAF